MGSNRIDGNGAGPRGHNRGSRSPGPLSLASAQRLHIAVVYAADGIRYLTAAFSEEKLLLQLAEYVRENAGRLWPEDAARVKSLLRRDRILEAADAYFASVGERWDPERLYRKVLPAR